MCICVGEGKREGKIRGGRRGEVRDERREKRCGKGDENLGKIGREAKR